MIKRNNQGLPYAENMNYWETGSGSPDQWIEKTADQIKKLGGVVIGLGYGESMGRAAYMVHFEINGDQFRLIWPVLPTQNGKGQLSAKRQAATMIYHDTKGRCLAAQILGSRVAFFSYYLLPDGRTAGEAAAPELADYFPRLLSGAK